MIDLNTLAERCEQASGPDRESDVLIASLVWSYRGEGPPAYSSSIDAAMTLVMESNEATAIFWRLGNDGEGGDPALFKAQILVCTKLVSKSYTAVADTAPLALCAAALRARSAQPPSASPQEGE